MSIYNKVKIINTSHELLGNIKILEFNLTHLIYSSLTKKLRNNM